MYTDQTQITGYLQRNLTEAEATIVTGVIKAVGESIDTYTGRSWDTGAEGEVRHYEGGEQYLIIDPVIDIESVAWVAPNGDVQNVYDSTDYKRYPLNSEAATQLRLNTSVINEYSSDLGYGGLRWPSYGTIKVTGKFGMVNGIPDDIRLAATIMASKCLVSNPSGNVRKEMIEGYTIEYFSRADQDDPVAKILDARKVIRL